MTYKEYIEKMRKEWIGKKVSYYDGVYNVVDVDDDGYLLIDRPQEIPTTAVETSEVEKIGGQKQ